MLLQIKQMLLKQIKKINNFYNNTICCYKNIYNYNTIVV